MCCGGDIDKQLNSDPERKLKRTFVSAYHDECTRVSTLCPFTTSRVCVNAQNAIVVRTRKVLSGPTNIASSSAPKVARLLVDHEIFRQGPGVPNDSQALK